ncbi:ATP-binding protein [Rhizobacter sp. Root1221]|uniref:ATP-binding protein n=1 Tax=Rhizobacter sp. Root1221 TaxID=1736433 RepID=UPI0006FF035B|nr:ATP-binding protein [Rhizobacter sp. Root1221]KQV91609.1 hypothetical protein ASC87_05835 [Rhizobacter sp. Root1221]
MTSSRAGLRLKMILMLAVALLPWLGSAARGATIDEWRAEAARVRLLAENDVPGAYKEAQRLQASLPQDASAVDRARVLNVLSRTETYLGLTDAAAEHAKEAFDIAASQGDRIGQAEADLNTALNSINQGRLDELVRATQHSVTVLEGIDRPDLLGEAMLRTTVMYRRFEQFNETAAIAVQAMEIARRSNNALAMTYAHQGLAVAYDQSGRPAEMREHYQHMREQAKAAQSKMLEGFAVSGLAGASLASGDLVDGERLSRTALAMFREVGGPFAEAFGLYQLATNLSRQKRHAEAAVEIGRAMAIFRTYPNRIGQWFGLNFESENRQTLGDMAGAKAVAERAYEIAKELGFAIYKSGSANRLADIAASAGDFQRAYELRSQARQLTAQMTKEGAGERMVQMIRRYETEGKQRAIDELTRRNEQQVAQLRQRELQQRWLWTLLAAVVFVLAGGAVFMARLRHSHHQLQALNLQLRQSENDVRALNAGLEQRVQARTGELRQQARYLRTLIDMLPMWAWFKDTGSRYLVVNQAHAQARGHSADAMAGKSDLELLPAALAQRQIADDAEVMASHERKTTEECVDGDGEPVWMETYKTAVLDDDGTLLGTVGVARNISDRKAAEAAREAALAEARQLARQRSEFLAQMSHELRTPLNGILGFAQILLRDKAFTERQMRGLKIIEESGQHLLTLINDILDLARIDAAKLEIYPTDVNLSGFMQVVCDIVRVKAEEKSLLFFFQREPDLPVTVRVDEKRLRQVLLNLLSNAVKFTDRGQVTLTVSCLSPSGGAPSDFARLRFEIQDSGIGMNEAQLARLFQPFEQVAEAKRREGGTGLGLAISRQLLRLMGGEIEVRSQPGVGSSFSFEIEVPIERARARALPVHAAAVGYEGARRRILVVDDVQQNRMLLLDSLGSLGFEVVEARHGAEAIEMAARRVPDLVILDMVMPVMDGFEAARRLRAAHGPGLPIIAASASASPQFAADSRKAGADAFVGKPIEQVVLLEAIGRLLKLTWLHEAPPAARDEEAGLDDTNLVAPPNADIVVLQHLALTGDMRAICDEADRLKGLDARYAAFSTRLRGLAENCQSRAVTAMLDRFSRC